MQNDLSRQQWTRLLAMLSLDAVQPLCRAMELPVGDAGAFQRLLRDVILEARRQYERDPASIPDVSRMLLDRLDPEAAANVAAWARGLFLGDHADQPEWSVWDIVFAQWAHSRADELSFLADDKRDAFLARYPQEVDTSDIRSLGGRIVAHPVSDWDLEVFARQGYGSSWESGPFSTAESIIRIQRLKKFAQAWWRTLSPVEQEALETRAASLVKALNVWMPGPVPRLGELLESL